MKDNNPQRPNWDKEEGNTKSQNQPGQQQNKQQGKQPQQHGKQNIRDVSEEEALDFGAKHGPGHLKEINKEQKGKSNDLRENFSSQQHQQKDKNLHNEKTEKHTYEQETGAKGQSRRGSK